MYLIRIRSQNWSHQAWSDVDERLWAWYTAGIESKLFEVISSAVEILPYRKYGKHINMVINCWKLCYYNDCIYIYSFWVVWRQDCYYTIHHVTIGWHLCPFALSQYLRCVPLFFWYHQQSTGRQMEKFEWHESIL